jgi:hypothetical protein
MESCWCVTVRSPKPGKRWRGYDIIECADFDEAIEIASKHAAAKFGTIEIRPVWQKAAS